MLLQKSTSYKQEIYSINSFVSDSAELEKCLNNNLSDKANNHDYHILYSFLFDKLGKMNPLNLLEIGLGTNNPNLISTMGAAGRPGASLYAFSEYLPNSNIYGADIDKDILFQTDRIKTCYVDQTEAETFYNIKINFGDIKYDLIIDDGLHSLSANLNTLLFALDNLKSNGWIVIEDIHIVENWKCIDFMLKTNTMVKTHMIKARGGYLYLIHKEV